MVSWKLALCILMVLTATACGHYPMDEPIPLSRCERNVPLLRFIPATMLPSTHFIPFPLSAAIKRVPRQTQSAVSNQFVINQNMGFGGSGGGGGGGGGGGLGRGRGGFGRGSFGRGGFGGGKFHPFFARTEAESESASCVTGDQQMAAMLPCPQNYILSCRPTLKPAPCSTAECASY